MSVTIFRQSAILDKMTEDDFKQICFHLYHRTHYTEWNELRAEVGNLLLDKGVRVFKDQGGFIQIINKE